MTTPPTGPASRVAAVFDRVADTYENVGVPWFAPIAEGLVDAVKPQAGEHVVDVGCGRGAALFLSADAVGASGRVVGLDVSQRMVELAAARVEELGLTTVELHVMDAGAPDLPAGEADVVTASLVLFFLPNPQEALRAWTALLRPGGRLGISTFAARDESWVELDRLFQPYLPAHMLDARTSGESGPFASDEGVEGLLAGAGLVDVGTAHADVDVTFADVDQWVNWSRSHGQRAMWEQVPADQQDALTQAAARVLEGCREQGGDIHLTQQVRYTLGRAPAADEGKA